MKTLAIISVLLFFAAVTIAKIYGIKNGKNVWDF